MHVLLFVVALLSAAALADAQVQAPAVELDLTAGHATEDDVNAAAMQVRTFGHLWSNTRFNVEGTWGRRSVNANDAFGAADVYTGPMRLSEAYVETMLERESRFVGVRLGRYRSPFGIFNRGDHAYSGFLRAPLIRYDGYWAITNGFREQGASVIVGVKRLSVEASVGVPGDEGIVSRETGAQTVVRGQAYVRSLIVGVSHIRSEPYLPQDSAPGRLAFTGVDARWMHAGVQLRGEWIVGQPWDGPQTDGGYVDVLVHRPFMGPVSAVLRSEWLNYESDVPFEWHGKAGYMDWQATRQTVGGRVRLPGGFTAQADVIRHSPELAYSQRYSLDVALTYSIRHN